MALEEYHFVHMQHYVEAHWVLDHLKGDEHNQKIKDANQTLHSLAPCFIYDFEYLDALWIIFVNMRIRIDLALEQNEDELGEQIGAEAPSMKAWVNKFVTEIPLFKDKDFESDIAKTKIFNMANMLTSIKSEFVIASTNESSDSKLRARNLQAISDYPEIRALGLASKSDDIVAQKIILRAVYACVQKSTDSKKTPLIVGVEKVCAEYKIILKKNEELHLTPEQQQKALKVLAGARDMQVVTDLIKQSLSSQVINFVKKTFK